MATQVQHTFAALRSMVHELGLRADVVATGLLSVETRDTDSVVTEATQRLSSVEAAEVRCVVVNRRDLALEESLLVQTLLAPSLAQSGARLHHADLVPLFQNEEEAFHSVYQPIVELGADRRTVGFEALLRARDGEGQTILPDRLFPAAEAAGWIHLLDRIGRSTALRDAGSWIGDRMLFINFIPTSIYRPEICLRTTERAAAEAGVRLDQLVFEVTEGHRVRDLDHLNRVFDYYRSHRCRVALDDLGAGHSSLNLLVRLQPDVVKLDKELTQALPGPVGRAAITAIVDIAHSYGGVVLAECVETLEQAEAAQELGVDLAQGWFFGRPQPMPSGPTTTSASTGTSVRAVSVAPLSVRAVRPELPDIAVALEGSGDPVGSSFVSTERELATLLLRAVETSVSGVTVADLRVEDQPLIYVNQGFEQLTGYRSEDVVGRNCRFLQGPDTDPEAVRALGDAVKAGREHRVVLRNYRKDGSMWWNELHLSPVFDEAGRLVHCLGFQYDVTARVEAAERLRQQATHDGVTGLVNRSSLVRCLSEALSSAERDARAAAVLFLDLDGFKQVNDQLGHDAGDRILVEVAERAKAVIRPGDYLARYGGDEFVAVLVDVDPLDVDRIAQRAAREIVASLQRPFVVGGRRTEVSGSIGIALYPEDATTTSDLLSRADAAMYEAKVSGPGGVRRATSSTFSSRSAGSSLSAGSSRSASVSAGEAAGTDPPA
jgi:diguanylate cyclase (GGDEF)-like protein/PAS domain S-box-containing protein